MLAVILATTCAVVYGTADFFGGLATKRSQVLSVVVLSQLAGLALVTLLLPVLPGAYSGEALAWGMGAGVAGGLGLVLFYRALASGVMSVVAPTTAVTSTVLPVLFGLATGERPHVMALAGIVLAVAAVVLVSRSPASGSRTSTGAIVSALLAGAGFGGFFILVALAPEGAGMWSLVGARLTSVSLVALLAVVARRSLRPGPGSLKIIVAAGVLDMAANVLYLLAEQQGLLSLVAVLVSLYPASTLVLARFVLGERLQGIQVAGVAFALGAVALIAIAP